MTARGICEKGNVREENQDSILIRIRKNSGLFIVADGVGGALYGAQASRYLTDSFSLWWDTFFMEHFDSSFDQIFDNAKMFTEELNRDLITQYGMGECCSTIALLLVHKKLFGCLSAGDSRIYTCDRIGARQITRDDIWENQPNLGGHSPYEGKILSAVGALDSLEYSCITDRAERGMSFLLCSDGIYKYVLPELISMNLKDARRKPLLRDRNIRRLAEAAQEAGTDDNYSLIMVKA